MSSRSRYFEKACEDTFKVGWQYPRPVVDPLIVLLQEGKQGEITLEEDDPDIVDRMIDYLYRLDYDGKATKTYGCLRLNALVYAMAEKYEILPLKELAKQKTAEAMERGNWGMEAFVEALDTVWTTTPQSDRGLRDQCIPFFLKHKHIIRSDKIFVEIVRNNGDLAVDIVQALLYESD